MKTIVSLQFPVEPFNTLVRQGTAGKILSEILEDIKPETVYFYATNGCRGGMLVVDVADAARSRTAGPEVGLTSRRGSGNIPV